MREITGQLREYFKTGETKSIKFRIKQLKALKKALLENDEKSIEDEVDLKFKIKKLYKKMKEILKQRERCIIELRFGLDGSKPKTQHEIAEMMGISRSYVSRIETKAIKKLSKEFEN